MNLGRLSNVCAATNRSFKSLLYCFLKLKLCLVIYKIELVITLCCLNSLKILFVYLLMFLYYILHLLIWNSYSLIHGLMNKITCISILTTLNSMKVLAWIAFRTCLSCLWLSLLSQELRFLISPNHFIYFKNCHALRQLWK